MNRKHKREILLWLDNPDAEVWAKGPNMEWQISNNPPFGYREYRTILPEYAEAWQAYLDGELQYLIIGRVDHWEDWLKEQGVPEFSMGAKYYRRKPRREEREPLRQIETIDCSGDGEWTVSILPDGQCHIYDPDGRTAHRSADHMSTALHLAMMFNEIRQLEKRLGDES